MKICKTYMQKVARMLWFLYGSNEKNWKAAKMEADADLFGEWIDDMEQNDE